MKKNDSMALRQKASQASRLLKNLSNTSRLLVLCELVNDERNVSELVRNTGMSQPHVSQLLSRFKKEGLVKSQRKGKEIYYKLHSGCVAEILGALWKEFCKESKKKVLLGSSLKSGAGSLKV